MKCRMITCSEEIRPGTPYCEEHCDKLVKILDKMFEEADKENSGA
jgi:hypothetical protein